jgi:urease accessory protein
MRARFPKVAAGRPPEAVLINTAGGLTGGDRVEMDVTLEGSAAATITTQAHEKVYRSVDTEDAAVRANIQLAAGAALDWLPQPTILFDRARLNRQTHVEMAVDARLLAVEAVIFGRTAMDERMLTGALCDHFTVRRGGALVHADRFALKDQVSARLDMPSVLNGGAAMATIRLVSPDAVAQLEAARAVLAQEGAASAWNGMLLARLVAPDGYRLGLALGRLLPVLRGCPLPPVWSI